MGHLLSDRSKSPGEGGGGAGSYAANSGEHMTY